LQPDRGERNRRWGVAYWPRRVEGRRARGEGVLLMRKVVLAMSVSIDGFMEGPNREIDWHLVDEELHQFFNDRLRGMGAFVNGRVVHELMAGFWPTADQDPGASPQMVEFAGIWREMPKIVYSRTLTTTEWNT